MTNHDKIANLGARDANKMNKPEWIAVAAGALLGTAAALFIHHLYNTNSSSAREDLLGMMPGDAAAVLFVNLAELRTAPFVTQLFAWAPQPELDEDYARFIKQTNFNYERDLDHFAIAFEKAGQDSAFFAVADGRFDHQKISALAAKSGTVERRNGSEIFAIPETSAAKKVYLKFLSNDRIALTNRSDPRQILGALERSAGAVEWRARFERVAGSPIFAVIRQDAAPGAELSAPAPGGFRSPELSSMLDQLLWITLAGKTENDRLRLVVEGESATDDNAVRFADLLNGVLTLAETGLNDAKTRQQLDPSLREAYLTLLKGADVSRINRGDTKSVRLAFEITPEFLESARRFSTRSTGDTLAKPATGSTAPRSKKGHT